MKQWIVAIGAILVGLVLGLALLGPSLGIGPDPDDDDDDDDWWDPTDNKGKAKCTGTCTMFIQDAVTNKIYTAEVSIAGETIGEAMMLSFGQGIRTTELKPMQSTPGDGGDGTPTSSTSVLYKDKPYKIWGSVKYKVTGSDMRSIDSATIEFYGKAGAASSSSTPDHQTGNDALYCGPCSSSKVVKTQNGLTSGTEYTVDSSTGKFDQVKGSSTYKLTGDTVDGAVLTVYIKVIGTDNGGSTVTASAMASMRFSVPSYGAGSLSVSITALNGNYEVA